MKRILLCSVFLLMVSLLVKSANCQEEDDSDTADDGFWGTFRGIFKKFVKSLKEAWGDFTKEVNARMQDFRGWTDEAWQSFKKKMKDWVDEKTDVTESERSDMKNFIERLKMPEENGEEKKE